MYLVENMLNVVKCLQISKFNIVLEAEEREQQRKKKDRKFFSQKWAFDIQFHNYDELPNIKI